MPTWDRPGQGEPGSRTPVRPLEEGRTQGASRLPEEYRDLPGSSLPRGLQFSCPAPLPDHALQGPPVVQGNILLAAANRPGLTGLENPECPRPLTLPGMQTLGFMCELEMRLI